MADRPNVLLITFDTARADAFEPYGAPRGSSPAVADLARRGDAHPAAYANACWTVPSHASMFTGMLPRQAGLIRAPGGRPRGCAPVLEGHRDRLLASVMGSAGYATWGVSTNLWIASGTGFETGFDRFHTVDTRRQAEMDRSGPRARSRWLAEGIRARVDDGAAEAREVVARHIAEKAPGADRRPFFGFVNLVESHSPYLPPKPYSSLGPLARGRAALDARKHLNMSAIWRTCAGGPLPPDGALERMRTLYADSIRLLDDWLASILELLDRSGQLGETLLIVCADHGENFGEGGLTGHAYSLDQRLIRVPLVLAGPAAHLPRGPLSLASLPSLIAEAAGIGDHPYAPIEDEPGITVAQFDPPAASGDPRVAQALEEWGLPGEFAPRITTPLTSATDGRFKLLRAGSEDRLYDLGADPLELEPRLPRELPEAPLEALLKAVERGDSGPGTDSSAGPVGGDPGPIDTAERERLEERMRMLGYL